MIRAGGGWVVGGVCMSLFYIPKKPNTDRHKVTKFKSIIDVYYPSYSFQI